MADTKLTWLAELASVAWSDIVYIVDDPAGTPISKKATVTNLLAWGLFLANVVEDTTPQLGGNLDCQGNNLTSVWSITSSNAIATTIADTTNVVGLTVTQNDTTNNPIASTIVNTGTGSGLFIDQNNSWKALDIDGDANSASHLYWLWVNVANSGAGNAYSAIFEAWNVGIGVTDPDEQLEMTGRIHLWQTTAPWTTTDKLYNVWGTLYWNGTDLTAGWWLTWGDSITGTTWDGINVNVYGSATQATGNTVGYQTWVNFNTSSIRNWTAIEITNENNGGTGENTGLAVFSKASDMVVTDTSAEYGRWCGARFIQQDNSASAIAWFVDPNSSNTSNGWLNAKLSNSMTGANTLIKLDTGTSAQWHTCILINAKGASTSQKWIEIDIGSWSWSSINAKKDDTSTGVVAISFDDFNGAGYYMRANKFNDADSNWAPSFFDLDVTSKKQSALTWDQWESLLRLRRTIDTAVTVSDNFDLLTLRRYSLTDNAGATYNAAWSILSIANTSVQTSWTLNDSVVCLKLTQDDDSTGGHILFNAYSGTPTADGTLWFDWSDLKLRAWSTTYTLTKS